MALEGIGQHGNIGNSPWNERKEDKGIKVKGTGAAEKSALCFAFLCFFLLFLFLCFAFVPRGKEKVVVMEEGEGEMLV